MPERWLLPDAKEYDVAETFKLSLLTPYCGCFEADVEGGMLPGRLGEFGVLSNHTKFASELKPGAVRIVSGGHTSIFSISGGFAEVSDNGVIILADSAEKPEDIDVDRARESKLKAEKELSSIDPSDEKMTTRLQNRIERANNRINLASSH